MDEKSTAVPDLARHLKELQATLVDIPKKIENMPLEQIGGDLRQSLQSMNRTLVSADQTVKRLDKDVSPAAKATLEDARRMLNTADRTLASDAPLQQDLRTSLRELIKGRAIPPRIDGPIGAST